MATRSQGPTPAGEGGGPGAGQQGRGRGRSCPVGRIGGGEDWGRGRAAVTGLEGLIKTRCCSAWPWAPGGAPPPPVTQRLTTTGPFSALSAGQGAGRRRMRRALSLCGAKATA